MIARPLFAASLLALLAASPCRALVAAAQIPASPASASHANDASLDDYRKHLQALTTLVEACAKARDLTTCDPMRVGPDDHVPLGVSPTAERRLIRYGWLRVLLSKAQEPDKAKDQSTPKPSQVLKESPDDEATLPPPPTTTDLLQDAETRLAHGAVARSAIRRTGDRAAVATAAELLGLTETMITMAADYAKERHQFGQPIGGFQAVKHLLAGAQVKLEFARPVVYGAAWALDTGDPTATRAASTAKAGASDAATEAARVALQVHGAIGYTWECDLHLFLKRAWALSEAWGSAADHRASVLASLIAGD